MFRISKNVEKDLNIYNLELFDRNKSCYAKIYLNQGASLQELTLSGHVLIKDMNTLTYDNTYTSAILFPFANRIKDGSYEFDKKTYQLDINEKGLNNAIHGLVYNKTFEVIDQEATETYASVKLVYHENHLSQGFPFTYTIHLEYVLTESALDLNVKISNTDSKTFPFTLGWHPYFLSSNLYESYIDFSSDKKIVFDERNITTGVNDFEKNGNFEILDKFLDDCFVLNSKEILFNTPKYNLELS
ncbi:MAG: aldose 1-epimerase, partial [Gelidibacter sp.]|nr:aldose 1-epimerase [Gelidibacter sp.]